MCSKIIFEYYKIIYASGFFLHFTIYFDTIYKNLNILVLY